MEWILEYNVDRIKSKKTIIDHEEAFLSREMNQKMHFLWRRKKNLLNMLRRHCTCTDMQVFLFLKKRRKCCRLWRRGDTMRTLHEEPSKPSLNSVSTPWLLYLILKMSAGYLCMESERERVACYNLWYSWLFNVFTFNQITNFNKPPHHIQYFTRDSSSFYCALHRW